MQSLKDRLIEILPKDSIGRYDLLPIFGCTELFSDIIDFLSTPYFERVDYVVAPEAIGWVIGSAIAKKLEVGFIPIRKLGKLPYPQNLLLAQSYVDYSGKTKSLEIKRNCVGSGSRILIVDEWVETGATLNCCIDLLKNLDCITVGLATIGINTCSGTKDWIDNGLITFIGKDM
ncbi:MAG: adenine phosphoribosyltransferase [Oscillospiraceae bacterium]|nr:adenine phosphoribosyltransferase [Oscillospiraceae bacterium]